jgi:hypothetical protein
MLDRAGDHDGFHMQTVVLVGTAHKFQRPVNEPNADGIAQFRNMIKDLCPQHEIAAIAEEMSWYALQEQNVTESVAQQVCALLGLRHQLSDPSLEERYKLGIRQDNDIRAEHMFDGWTQEQIEADVLARGSVPSDKIREQFWLRRIQELDVWPLLFICGAHHFTPFATLLSEAGVSVVEAHQDWKLKIETG